MKVIVIPFWVAHVFMPDESDIITHFDWVLYILANQNYSASLGAFTTMQGFNILDFYLSILLISNILNNFIS